MTAQKQQHNIEPVYNKSSRVLILGSFPSVKSRETEFFYGHPQNRFWRLLAALLKENTPKSTQDKKQLLLKHNIAVWDVIKECDIVGSSDTSITNALPNDISLILDSADIRAILCNGTKAYELYNKYIGDWGGSSKEYVFEGYKNGEPVKTLKVTTIAEKCISVTADHTVLKEGRSYDVAGLRIKMLDENGRVLPFYNDPVTLSVEGPIELIGPSVIGMSGGMGGTYVKTTGGKGQAKLTIETTDGVKETVEFTCE